MSTEHLTLTEADIRAGGREHRLSYPPGDDRILKIHTPHVRGINLAVTVLLHDDEHLESPRNLSWQGYAGFERHEVEVELPPYVERVTITTPPIPDRAQVIEVGDPFYNPATGEHVTLLDTEGGHIAVRLPDGHPGEIPHGADIAEHIIETGTAPIDETLRARSAARCVNRGLNDIGLRQSKAKWQAVAVARGKQLDDRDYETDATIARIDALRDRAQSLGAAARELRAQLRDAGLEIVARGAEINKVQAQNERQSATILEQRKRTDDLMRQMQAGAEDANRLTEALSVAERDQRIVERRIATLDESISAKNARIRELEGQLDEARAERDHAQEQHSQTLAEIHGRAVLSPDDVEALNGVLRRVDHEGSTEGVSLVDALRLAAQQWDGLRKELSKWRKSSREAHDRAVEYSNDLDDVNDELRNVRKALAMSDQTITERDETIERMREQHAEGGRLNAAMRSELGSLRGERLNRHYGFTRHTNAPCTLAPFGVSEESFWIDPDATARRGGVLGQWDQTVIRPRQAGKTAEAFVRGGIGRDGIDAVGLIAKLAPELVLETIGVNRKTFARTVENLRRARGEIREYKRALRSTIDELREVMQNA